MNSWGRLKRCIHERPAALLLDAKTGDEGGETASPLSSDRLALKRAPSANIAPPAEKKGGLRGKGCALQTDDMDDAGECEDGVLLTAEPPAEEHEGGAKQGSEKLPGVEQSKKPEEPNETNEDGDAYEGEVLLMAVDPLPSSPSMVSIEGSINAAERKSCFRERRNLLSGSKTVDAGSHEQEASPVPNLTVPLFTVPPLVGPAQPARIAEAGPRARSSRVRFQEPREEASADLRAASPVGRLGSKREGAVPSPNTCRRAGESPLWSRSSARSSARVSPGVLRRRPAAATAGLTPAAPVAPSRSRPPTRGHPAPQDSAQHSPGQRGGAEPNKRGSKRARALVSKGKATAAASSATLPHDNREDCGETIGSPMTSERTSSPRAPEGSDKTPKAVRNGAKSLAPELLSGGEPRRRKNPSMSPSRGALSIRAAKKHPQATAGIEEPAIPSAESPKHTRAESRRHHATSGEGGSPPAPSVGTGEAGRRLRDRPVCARKVAVAAVPEGSEEGLRQALIRAASPPQEPPQEPRRPTTPPGPHAASFCSVGSSAGAFPRSPGTNYQRRVGQAGPRVDWGRARRDRSALPPPQPLKESGLVKSPRGVTNAAAPTISPLCCRPCSPLSVLKKRRME